MNRRLLRVRTWHASKGSGEPPRGFYLVSVALNRCWFVRYPRWLRALFGRVTA